MNSFTNTAITTISFLLVLPLAILIEGIFRKLVARMQNRKGPSLLQPFYDLEKLFRKGESDSKGYQNILFRIVPIVYFLVNYSLFLFLLGVINFKLDFIMFIYMLILSGAFYILLGLISNSPFGAIGSLRDMLLMVSYEMGLIVSIMCFILYTGVSSISYFNQSWLFFELPLASLAMIIVALVEVKITPFDTVEAEPEIAAGIETEYSGKELAFISLAKDLKFLFFIFLLTRFLFNPGNIISYLIFSFFIFFILMFSEVVTARYKINETFNLLIFVLFLSVIEFIRISGGIIWG